MKIVTAIGVALLLLIALPIHSFAKEALPARQPAQEGIAKNRSANYPAVLIGQWEPGPNPCKLPLSYDSDGGFVVKARLLRGYEHTDTPRKVQRISQAPQAWRIEATEEYGDDRRTAVDIYVLRGDYLTVTDGERSKTYSRCR